MSDINQARSGEYEHIRVGVTDDICSREECASILGNSRRPIFEISVGSYGVAITEACDYFFHKVMTKTEAIAALNELIHYIEANADG